MEKWTVLSSNYVIDNFPYNRTRKDRCRLSNGVEIDLYIHEYPNWVNAIVLTPEKELILVNQYRHGIKDFTVETPGGMVDEGEPELAAIVREVTEETGYVSDTPPVLLGKFLPNPATSNNWVSTYLFLNAKPIQHQSLDKTEEIKIKVIPFETFGKMIHDRQAPQMFSAMGYYLAKDYLATHYGKDT